MSNAIAIFLWFLAATGSTGACEALAVSADADSDVCVPAPPPESEDDSDELARRIHQSRRRISNGF